MAHDEKPPKEVAIHIDKQEHKSPNPTTGMALYVLGTVNPDTHDLYRETHGNEDDEQIFNNSNSVNLKNGDHFFSIKKKLNPGSARWL
ncbi:MAG TPA: hypothetical protein VIX17_29895 [Pyrinomonadaceae bacterium]|jgi:hypothetical protein